MKNKYTILLVVFNFKSICENVNSYQNKTHSIGPHCPNNKKNLISIHQIIRSETNLSCGFQ